MQYYYLDIHKYMYILSKGFMKPYLLHVMNIENATLYLFI